MVGSAPATVSVPERLAAGSARGVVVAGLRTAVGSAVAAVCAAMRLREEGLAALAFRLRRLVVWWTS